MEQLNRRKFFKVSGVLAGSILASGGIATSLQAATHNHTKQATTNQSNQAPAESSCAKQPRGRMFFTNDLDFNNLKAATQRIYPKDSSGGGAIELGVPYFIDNQLASGYGFNAREYMQGPFMTGKSEQGYQTPMNRREIFTHGLNALENQSQQRYKKSFADIKENEQDAILKDFEANKVEMIGIPSSYFFGLLRELTIAGVLSDPIYQGNDAQQGWKMIGYPGGQMSYSAFITSDEFVELPPMSLADMQ